MEEKFFSGCDDLVSVSIERDCLNKRVGEMLFTQMLKDDQLEQLQQSVKEAQELSERKAAECEALTIKLSETNQALRKERDRADQLISIQKTQVFFYVSQISQVLKLK